MIQSKSIGCNNDAKDEGGKKVNKTISLPGINLFTNRSRDLTTMCMILLRVSINSNKNNNISTDSTSCYI